MTVKQETRSWLSVAALALVVSIGSNALLVAFWGGKLVSRIETVEKHVEDRTVHMPLDQKIELFVTRNEYQDRRNEINDRLDRIEIKLDRLLEAQGK